MKLYLRLIFFGIIWFFAINSQASPMTAAATNDRINHTVKAWMQKNNVPGVAVEIYKNGIPHSYYFGYANLLKKTPVTAQTIFELGSITKLFTTLLLAEQMNAGTIALNDPITKYISYFTPNNPRLNQVTIENLATFTSGFPFDISPQTNDQLTTFLQTWSPLEPVGTQWNYSNIDIGLLGNILEIVTHENFNQQFRQSILIPLGMDPIAITVPKRYQKFYAQGYSEAGTAVSPVVDELFPAADAIKASGHDMLIFLKTAIGLSNVPKNIALAIKTTQKTYVSTSEMQQGLGWIINLSPEKNKMQLLNPPTTMNLGPIPATQLSPKNQKFYPDALIEKTGATDGFRAYIGVIPKQKSGIVILVNRYVANGAILKLARGILLDP